jgi:hypothetical protein
MRPSLSYLRHFLSVMALLVISAACVQAQDDPGRKKIGTLDVTVYYGTDGDPAAAGANREQVSETTKNKLQATAELRFNHYLTMGRESKTIFRSYENWAQPLNPSDEILIRFETRMEPTKHEVPLNIELWLSRKKILKSDLSLKHGQPLYVLGPEWRGGRLIIAIELASKNLQIEKANP